jgi:hypothetical protein
MWHGNADLLGKSSFATTKGLVHEEAIERAWLVSGILDGLAIPDVCRIPTTRALVYVHSMTLPPVYPATHPQHRESDGNGEHEREHNAQVNIEVADVLHDGVQFQYNPFRSRPVLAGSSSEHKLPDPTGPIPATARLGAVHTQLRGMECNILPVVTVGRQNL